MKFTGDMLVAQGLKSGNHFGPLLRALNTGSYTESGMKELIQGFVNHKLPKRVHSNHGPITVSLEVLKIFCDYEKTFEQHSLKLADSPIPYKVFGGENIEKGAFDQMNNAMSLPVAVAGALMSDAHQGYALPIGGVFATENVIIPNAVGVDISCRMRFSAFDVEFPSRNSLFKEEMRKALRTQTLFGTGHVIKDTIAPSSLIDPILDDERWNLPLVRKANLRLLAINQLSSSGGGNHFVDWGTYTTNDGRVRLGLLTHSGSRGVGYKIAKLYTSLAVSRFTNKDFHGFAWLDMDSDEGKEYWDAMHLAGDFAQVSHRIIHERISKFMKLSPVESYETNHNFAWRENHVVNGVNRDLIVHRKGAVRAHQGEMGIIGGTMGTPSFIVEGKGNVDSLCSCSHGSGRAMSRKAAKEAFTKKQMADFLLKAGVELLEGGLDECPMAYKDIEKVMNSQKDSINIIGKFDPKIVMMGEEEEEG